MVKTREGMSPIHLSKTRGGAVCGRDWDDSAYTADINVATCEDCIEQHEEELELRPARIKAAEIHRTLLQLHEQVNALRKLHHAERCALCGDGGGEVWVTVNGKETCIGRCPACHGFAWLDCDVPKCTRKRCQ